MSTMVQEKQDLSILARIAGFFKPKKNMDMTEGSIRKIIITFALPLLIGNLFQQLYNTVDTYVVGNYVSNAAFAAVGNIGPIINTLIGFFSGFSAGAGVVISQYYGAKDEKNVSRAVHTTIVSTVFLAVVFTFLGILMTPMMLRFMNFPDDVFAEGYTYLTIYFAGVTGLMIYNVGAGILRAVGDSQRPFYFLAISAVLNVVLDLTFVIGFKMGVEGVAYATVISQCVSAVLVMVVLFTSRCCRVYLSELKCSWKILWKIIKVGFPAAIQMAITSFSNVFVQSYISFYGTDFMSGWSAYSKIDQFLFLPMQSLSLAVTTFVGQNLGAGKVKRAKKGANVALVMALITTVSIMIPMLLFAPHLVRFFNKEEMPIHYGAILLRLMSPFYLFCCVNQTYSGALRGAGKASAPMIIMLSCFVGFRQLYLALTFRFENFILTSLAYPAGWALCATIMFTYYRLSKWKVNVISKEEISDKSE